MQKIMDIVRERRVIIDGGMGSLLQSCGLRAGELPEIWNLTHRDVMLKIHTDYLDAGCDIVTANTFGANPFKYPASAADGEEYTLESVVTAALDISREAVQKKGHGFVAMDIGPTGRLLQPMGDLEFETCVDAYKQVIALAKDRADLILIETMSDMYELKAAVLAAKEASDLPVLATVAFDASGKLLTGGTPESVVALLEGLKVDALGLNCGLGPADMAPFAKRLLDCASVPVIVQPNAGLPRVEAGVTRYDLGAGEYAEQMKEILSMGAAFVGGCCGTTPEHIRALKEIADKTAGDYPRVREAAGSRRSATLVSGFADAVEIGDDPVIIGERINPTGKKRFQQALREGDMEYILGVGLSEQEQGAQILDVNVGLPEIDETDMMVRVVKELQGVTELPLQIDTSDPKALSAAMRIYNGKPLINSVNGKKEVMEAVFPLVKKYGGVVVCLTLDENGIPETAAGRFDIAARIIAEAARYGIQKKDLIVDTLCMTISSEEKGAVTTLKAMERVRKELGVRTVLGVSNISFGLPARDIVNGIFFALALERGLSAGIINPGSADMMRAFHAFRALKALDAHCATYIETYQSYQAPAAAGGGVQGPAPRKDKTAPEEGEAQGDASALSHAIKKGLKDQAQAAAADALKTNDALSVINDEMMPALDDVGRGFEQGSLFLPQLIMSAEAARAAFDVIRAQMDAAGGGTKKGKVVIATVRGDIHDIGKNIVKVLLENYNFDVIDLGKDVAPETVAETVLRENARLVGLSALMTTTVPAMEETIILLRKKAPDVKVMVGGAVMTKEYAKQIGADHYAKDAMGAVSYAEHILTGSDVPA